MIFRDVDRHHAPHIHVEYQGRNAVYSIEGGEILAGELPPSKHKLVVAWIELRQEDLMADWTLAVAGSPLQNIRGLE